MNLEDLMVIWNSQAKEPLFALNEAALHSIVRRRNESVERCAALRYAVEISIGVLCGAGMVAAAGVLALGHPFWPRWPRVPANGWDIASLLLAGAIWFYYAAYMNHARRKQMGQGAGYESTIRGDIDRTLAQVAFQTGIDEGILWKGYVPIWISNGFWCFTLFRLSGAPTWIYFFMAAIMAVALTFAVWLKNATIRNRYRPMRSELETLRRKLSEVPSQAA